MRQCNPNARQPIRMKSRIDMPELLEAAQQQTRPGKQGQGERDLADDNRVAQSPAAAVFRTRSLTVAESLGSGRSSGMEARSETRNQRCRNG